MDEEGVHGGCGGVLQSHGLLDLGCQHHQRILHLNTYTHDDEHEHEHDGGEGREEDREQDVPA